MDTHFLIAFDPEATPPAPPVEPAPAVALTFAVVLNGVRSMHTVPPGLSAQLTIPFSWAGTWARLCERAAFAGISPLGHAPLILPSASYLGSTCQYAPGDAQPWIVYLDDPQSAQVLKIGPPTENLWSWFQWPTATVTFAPDLTAHEQRPPLWFDIASFTDVQIPMRLQFEIPPDPLDPKPTTVLVRELIYDDAPTFTASAYRVTCSGTTEHPLPMEVTGPEIATALTAAGYTDGGIYDLYWRIYRGAGDMVYRARCIESDLGTITDRIVGSGGGFGIELDTDLLVARILAEPKPFPFLIETVDGRYGIPNTQYNVSADGEIRQPTPVIPAGAGTWVGSDPATEVLTWSGATLYLGRHTLDAPATIRCACLVQAVLGDEQTETACVLVYLTDGAVRRMALDREPDWSLLNQLAAPSWTYLHPGGGLQVLTPPADRYAFSQDGTLLLGYVPHQLLSERLYPAAVWETALDPEAAWARVYDNDVYSTITTSGTADDNQQGWVYAGQATVFLHAEYHGTARIVQELRAIFSSASHFEEDRSETLAPANKVMSGPLSPYVRRVQEGEGLPTEALIAYALEGSHEVDETLVLHVIENGTLVRSRQAVARQFVTLWSESAPGSGRTWGDVYPEDLEPPDLMVYVAPASPADPYPLTEEEIAEAQANREEFSTGKDTSFRSVLAIPRHCRALFWARLFRQYEDQAQPDGIVAVVDDAREVLAVTEDLINIPQYGDTVWPLYPVPRAEAHAGETQCRMAVLTALDHAITQDGTKNGFFWDARANADTAANATALAAYVRTYSAQAVGLVTADEVFDLSETITGRVDWVRLTVPRACLTPARDGVLPSGDPVIPPTYDALLDAIQAARAAAGVPSAQGDPVITDLAVTGGLTYTETFLSVAAVGVIAQTWTLIITDAVLGTFRLDGDTLGEVATGSPNATLAPLNPDTNTPYFVLLPGGWGGVHPLGATLTFRTAPAPLTEDAALVISTAIHCQWMLDHASVTELGIDDTTPLARARLAGYAGASVGELRGVIATTVQEPLQGLCDAWLADPDTAAILLDPAWTRLGGYLIPWPGTGYLACVACGTEPPNE